MSSTNYIYHCIRPELEYAATVWSHHLKGQIDTLESIQKLALCLCFRKQDVNYHTLLSTNNIPSLYKRRLLLRLLLYMQNYYK